MHLQGRNNTSAAADILKLIYLSIYKKKNNIYIYIAQVTMVMKPAQNQTTFLSRKFDLWNSESLIKLNMNLPG